jgi:uracil-DNA glycosylase
MTPKQYISLLAAYQSPNTFNPYADACPFHDRKHAVKTRSNNLWHSLNAMRRAELDALWIGRDLGYRGGRRTGLALVDEAYLPVAAQRWQVPLKKATTGEVVAERTAKNIRLQLLQIEEPVFMWNVFPFHPHAADQPFSNRSHTAAEREDGLAFLEQLIKLLRPKRLVAIGNDAAAAASRIANKEQVLQVRHPSYGGETIFRRQIAELYGLPN